MLNQRTAILWAVLAAALFVLLLGARALVSNVSVAGPDVAGAYTELGQALQQARVLPLGADDELLLNLVRLARDASTVYPQGEPATSGDLITLGSVIEARSAERMVVELKLRPRYHRELVPGALSQALRKLAGLNAKAQLAAGPLPGSQSQAQFSFTVAEDNYQCLANFTGKRLDELVIIRQ